MENARVLAGIADYGRVGNGVKEEDAGRDFNKKLGSHVPQDLARPYGSKGGGKTLAR